MNIKSPKGWKIVKISDVATVSAGGTPRRDRKEYWENGTINWLKNFRYENKIYIKN